MRKELHESYCFRESAKVAGFDCFIGYVYGDRLTYKVYGDGHAWYTLYSGDKMVACYEGECVTLVNKRFECDKYGGYASFNYKFVRDLEYVVK